MDKAPMTFRTIAQFVAMVMRNDDPRDQGLLYVRLAHPEHRNRFARIQGGENGEIIYFDTLAQALDDARALARMGSHCCTTSVTDTVLDDRLIQQIVDVLIERGTLKVA